MYTTGVPFNIRCMFPSRGGGSCIPQVLLSIFGVCYHPVLQVHVYHRFCFRWRYMYTNILVSPRNPFRYTAFITNAVKQNTCRLRLGLRGCYTTGFACNIRCMLLTRGGGSCTFCIPQVLLAISGVFFHSVVAVHGCHRFFLRH